MKLKLALTLIACVTITACNSSNSEVPSPAPEPPTSGVSAPPDVQFASLSGTTSRREVSSDHSDALDLANNNNQFAIDFYHQQLTDNTSENLVISPASISLAFAMLYGGSANETKQEMRDVFYFQQEDEQLHQAFNTLSQTLLTTTGSDDFTLDIVNGQWGEQTYDFNADYLNLMSEFYGADIQLADITGQPDSVRQAINSAIEQQTESLISDLLPEGSVTESSKLVLTNAVYFKAKWQSEFHPGDTLDSAFNTIDSEEIEVPTMSQRSMFNLYSDNNEVLLELPYRNTDWSMYLLTVPVERFSEFEDNVNADTLNTMISNAVLTDAQIYIPKFSFDSSIDLPEVLENMGMEMAFRSDLADFSPINQREVMEFYVQAAVHKATITVDEEGTEASAATGVVFGVTSLPELVRFNQPFIFVVQHKPTGSILFMGRVMDPSA